MSPQPRLKVAVVSSSLPKECGIATFSDHLNAALRKSGVIISVAALHEQPHLGRSYPADVKRIIKDKDPDSYKAAADWINRGPFEVAVIQHEHGLYGPGDGALIFPFLERIKKPIVMVFHTVGLTSTARFRGTRLRQLRRMVALSHRTVVTSHVTKRGLVQEGFPSRKLVVLHHGTYPYPHPDPTRSARAKRSLDLAGTPILFSPGLIRDSKGLETTIRALPQIRKHHPGTTYLISGALNPGHRNVAYYEGLQQLAQDKRVTDGVRFEKRFMTDQELVTRFLAADAVVLPYRRLEQVSSGVLAEAVGAGTIPITTPFSYATELAAGNRGYFIRPGSAKAVAHAVIDLLDDPAKAQRRRERVYKFGQQTHWPVIGQKYAELLRSSARRT